jgi:hypothetical protein
LDKYSSELSLNY